MRASVCELAREEKYMRTYLFILYTMSSGANIHFNSIAELSNIAHCPIYNLK